MRITPAIIFINNDVSSVTTNNLKSQLMISEMMTDTEFDNRVIVDPNYPTIVHLQQLRILVVRQTLHDLTNRELADVVLFVKQGLVTVLKNNLGPPTLSMEIQRLNIFNLFANIKDIVCSSPTNKHCRCFRCLPVQLRDMLIDYTDPSGVHDANCDNIYNNEKFLNRK